MIKRLHQIFMLLGIGSALYFVPVIAEEMGVGAEVKARSAKRISVTLENATVYLKKAELFSTAEFSVPKGKSLWAFTNISETIDESTLTISANQQVVVQAIKLMSVPVNEAMMSEESQLAEKKRDEAYAKQKLNDAELDIINAKLALFNLKTDGIPLEKASVEAIEQMLILISEEMRPILVEKIRFEKEGIMLREKIQSLESMVQELKLSEGPSQMQQQLLVTLYAPGATKTTVDLSYFMDQAGWMPFYKIEADDASDQVNIGYKANIFQNSGFDWENVQLTLSTVMPQMGGELPQVFPWYVSIADEKKLAPKEERITRLRKLHPSQKQGQDVRHPLKDRYTIFTGGHAYPVAIKSEVVGAHYNYVAMPRLNTEVFFQAQIPEWKTLGLLSGRMHIYYKASLVGEGYINIDQSDQLLTIPLGQRRDIVIKRTNEAKQTNVSQVKGAQVTQPYQFTIEAFNGYGKAINLTIIDQIPLSRNSKITRSRIRLGNALYDERNGTLTWRFDIKPNASKKVNYAYTLKYPKGLDIEGL